MSYWAYRGGMPELLIKSMRLSKRKGVTATEFRWAIAKLEQKNDTSGKYGDILTTGLTPEFFKMIDNWVEMYERLKV